MTKIYKRGDIVEHRDFQGPSWNQYRVEGPAVNGKIRLTEFNKYGDLHTRDHLVIEVATPPTHDEEPAMIDIFKDAKPEDFLPLPCGARVVSWGRTSTGRTDAYAVSFDQYPAGYYNLGGYIYFSDGRKDRGGGKANTPNLTRKPAIQIGDQFVTRCGQPVEVLAFCPLGNPIVESKFGGIYKVARADLYPAPEEKPERRVAYVNVYSHGFGGTNQSIPDADLHNIAGKRTGLLKVTHEAKPEGGWRLVSVEVV